MLLIVRLLNMSPKMARAFRDFTIGFAAWTHADLDARLRNGSTVHQSSSNRYSKSNQC